MDITQLSIHTRRNMKRIYNIEKDFLQITVEIVYSRQTQVTYLYCVTLITNTYLFKKPYGFLTILNRKHCLVMNLHM